jgi:hypothetical protein
VVIEEGPGGAVTVTAGTDRLGNYRNTTQGT